MSGDKKVKNDAKRREIVLLDYADVFAKVRSKVGPGLYGQLIEAITRLNGYDLKGGKLVDVNDLPTHSGLTTHQAGHLGDDMMEVVVEKKKKKPKRKSGMSEEKKKLRSIRLKQLHRFAKEMGVSGKYAMKAGAGLNPGPDGVFSDADEKIIKERYKKYVEL